LVFTSKSNYFIAISAGNISVDDQQFYTISMDTPIGLLLTAKRIGDEVFFRDEKIKIENVF
jgi:transcription elongation GreA/GreB family factor